MEHWAVTLSERCYRTMLSLYPLEFRVRFRNEMAQVFRDSCRDELQNCRIAGLSRLWSRALVDLSLSIARERGRVLLDVRGHQVYEGGAIDTIVILIIIVSHLLAAGAGLTFYLPRTYETARGFFIVSTAMAAALGGLGVTCSLLLARFRRIQYRLNL